MIASESFCSTGTRSPSHGQACGSRMRAETRITGYTSSSTQEPHDIGDSGSKAMYTRYTKSLCERSRKSASMPRFMSMNPRMGVCTL